MRVFFGSSREGGVVVSLSREGKLLAMTEGSLVDDLLALFETALKKAKMKKTAIDEIVVDRGPAGFSAVRRRVAIATGLARALGAKIAASGPLSPEEAAALAKPAFAAKAEVAPLYAGEPSITISKKKKTWNAR